MLPAAVFLVAALYASVGHGGASGYLAAMALLGAASESMRPTALALNVLVAGVGTARYIRRDTFAWSAFWPFALGSVPFAFVGGASSAADDVYRRLLGAALVVAAVGMLRPRLDDRPCRPPAWWWAIPIGAGVGYLSGLIGVGGGIFLSPILILAGWATTRQSLGIAAAFILVNSLSGLAGHWTSLQSLPSETPVLAAAAFAGGLLGTELGARWLTPVWLRRTMGAVLAVAAAKLLLS